MGLKKGTENQAYLVDFGLANRVTEKEFKPDPKCAHNGTIEYTSRDAHLGGKIIHQVHKPSDLIPFHIKHL